MNLYRTLINHLAHKESSMFTNFLEAAYYSQRNFRAAIKCFEKGIAIARTIGDRIDEGIALSSLGGAHYFLGNYGNAIAYQKQ